MRDKYKEAIEEWEIYKEEYTTKELLDWIRFYGTEITILTKIIEERCRKEGFCIDIIKK